MLSLYPVDQVPFAFAMPGKIKYHIGDYNRRPFVRRFCRMKGISFLFHGKIFLYIFLKFKHLEVKMSAFFGLFGLIGAIITVIVIIIKSIKKQPKKKSFIALIIFLLSFIIGLALPSKSTKNNEDIKSLEIIESTNTSIPANTLAPTETFVPTNTLIPTDTSVPTDTLTPTDTSTPTNTPVPTNTSAPTQTPVLFILMDGAVGEYGKEIVLNSGTEFEELEITYHIPAGTYSVTNLNNKGTVQVSVYSGGPELDGEWESFVSDENCSSPIVVMSGETKELVIREGQFIVLSDGSDNVQFVLK